MLNLGLSGSKEAEHVSILQATGSDPVGAAALLSYADPVELERFSALEDAVWGNTTLSPAVTEAVRLHCANIRGCAFCSAVRITAAIEDGLSEDHISNLDVPGSRAEVSAEHDAALTLVDHFLKDPRRPDEREAIAHTLGTAGVMEVLLACGAFASADLRIALGENLEPAGSNIFERARGQRSDAPDGTDWPQLSGSVLDPDVDLPMVADSLANVIRQRLVSLSESRDLKPEIVAACAMRSAQLHGVDTDDPIMALLMPADGATVTAEEVRNWPIWTADQGRYEMELAEQLWIDPSSVSKATTDALEERHGVDGLIRIAWSLIFIGQLHRLVLVLQRD